MLTSILFTNLFSRESQNREDSENRYPCKKLMTLISNLNLLNYRVLYRKTGAFQGYTGIIFAPNIDYGYPLKRHPKSMFWATLENTVMILSFRTNRFRQTLQTQIRPLLDSGHFDKGLVALILGRLQQPRMFKASRSMSVFAFMEKLCFQTISPTI